MAEPMRKRIKVTTHTHGDAYINPAHIVMVWSPGSNMGATIVLVTEADVQVEETVEEVLRKIDELG